MRISALNIYPVKSLRGISVASAYLEREGLTHDRRWMVVDEHGKFRTQRTDARMATIATAIEGDSLVLNHALQGSVSVPLKREGDPVTVTVWAFTGTAVAVSREADEFLSTVLSAPCRLVGHVPETQRGCSLEYALESDRVSFADGFSVLLTNEASLEDLNARMENPLPMARFRPNIVVSGLAAWEEDDLRSFELQGIPMRNVKPCGRCIVTTTDQMTGERMGDEPLATLAKFRKFNGTLNFGANIVPDGEGTLTVEA